MLAHADGTPLDAPGACSRERSREAEVLLQAIDVLRRAAILTAAEYDAKRRRLLARL